MKINLLMICLLCSNAAAFATNSAVLTMAEGVIVAIVGRGGGCGFGRRAGSSGLGLFARDRKQWASATAANLDKSCINTLSNCKATTSTSMMLRQSSSLDNDIDHDNASTLTTSTPSSPPMIKGGYIAFRLARRSDVQQIQNCNLATLPENYNANFYVNHMRTWPELTLVAEHIPEGYDNDDDVRTRNDEEKMLSCHSERITPLSDYIRGRKQRLDNAGGGNKPQKEIVGYILGKIEERPIVNPPPRQIFPPSKVVVPLYNINNNDYEDDENNHDEETLLRYLKGHQRQQARPPLSRPPPSPPLTEKIGHVTSLAVHSHARRLGIATSLLSQLHYHLAECHGAQSVGLHVRISNKAAVRLYCDEGYDVADIIPFYYGDGEDAYFMKKDINSIAIVEKSGSGVSTSESRSPTQQQQSPPRRGEKERNEWLNRDAIRSGSFFEGRKSMRDTLSEEERAWTNPQTMSASRRNTLDNNSLGSTTGSSSSSSSSSHTNNPNLPPLISGQFRRSFHALMQHPHRDRLNNNSSSPPWEVGPESLRLPRYKKVVRRSSRLEDSVPVREDINKIMHVDQWSLEKR